MAVYSGVLSIGLVAIEEMTPAQVAGTRGRVLGGGVVRKMLPAEATSDTPRVVARSICCRRPVNVTSLQSFIDGWLKLMLMTSARIG